MVKAIPTSKFSILTKKIWKNYLGGSWVPLKLHQKQIIKVKVKKRSKFDRHLTFPVDLHFYYGYVALKKLSGAMASSGAPGKH